MSQIIPRNTLLGQSSEILYEIVDKIPLQKCYGLIGSCRFLYAFFYEFFTKKMGDICFTPETIHILGKEAPHLAIHVRSIDFRVSHFIINRAHRIKERLPQKMQKILHCLPSFNSKKRKQLFLEYIDTDIFRDIKDEKFFLSCVSVEAIRFPFLTAAKDFDIIAKTFRHLKKMDASVTEIKDVDLENLAQYCPDLTEVNLNSCLELTGKGVQGLVSYCRNLQVLQLGFTDSDSITEIAVYCLKNSPCLRKFNLGWTKVNEKFINALLENEHVLKVLNLEKCGQCEDLLVRGGASTKLLERGIKIYYNRAEGFE